MNLLNKKADNILPSRHGVFQVDSRELKDDNHSIKFELQQENEQIKLYIKSHLIEEDNYEILIKGSRLIVFISEKIEIGKPLYVHHVNRSAFEQNGYEKLDSCEYKLPEGDFTIKRTIWNKDKNRLEISLDKNYRSSVLKNQFKIIRRERS
jgi:hypothetical protein